MTSFSDLRLVAPLLRALHDEGYDEPTPIQSQAIPFLLEGRDLLGCARTGTGKTAAFALPILQRLNAHPVRASRKGSRVLVLVPTRELAAQVAQSFTAYGRHLSLSVTVVYGGVGQGPQVRALSHGVDVLVACPGRLLDLMQQGHVRLDGVEVLVLDEADQMLDLGFLPDVKRLLAAVPKKRQTLLFSATMPAPIQELADRILQRPERVFVTPAASPAERVEQRVHMVARADKPDLLEHLLKDPAVKRALVFTRTKRGADRVARRLAQGGIGVQAIHGDKSQGTRERAMAGFRTGKTRVLVATDIAARGIDIDDITHVVNFEMPNVPETYVHRIGRTARAGAEGVAISLCSPEEREFLRDIERLIKRTLPTVGEARGGSGPRDERPTRGPQRKNGARQGGHGQEPRRRGRGHGRDERKQPDTRGPRLRGGPGSIPDRTRHSARQQAPALDVRRGPSFGTGV